MSAHILVVEDDPALAVLLKAAIEFGGYSGDFAGTAEAALVAIDAARYDAVLLDLGLPDSDGDLLEALREHTAVPIIVVSGRDTERDKINALDRGADDFVGKPFLPGELLARIRAALRRAGSTDASAVRMAEEESTPIKIGGMTFDPGARRIGLNGQHVTLNAAEARVLRRLASDSGATVSRTELLEELYGDDLPGETNIVDVYISRIRNKLRQLPGGDDVIANVRGLGWRLRELA